MYLSCRSTGVPLRRQLQSSIIRRHYLHQTPFRQQYVIQSVGSLLSTDGQVDLKAFKEQAFKPGKPLLLKDEASSNQPPEDVRKWFSSTALPENSVLIWTLSSFWDDHLNWPFPFELVSPPNDADPPVKAFHQWLQSSEEATDQLLAGLLAFHIADIGVRSFSQVYAPLRLLKKALEFNLNHRANDMAPMQLYIAQSLIDDLPGEVAEDLPKPFVVRNAGRGDVYSSSVWLGTEPTYTPLHRDPNPNLFCQLCSSKSVRLLPPGVGDRVFYDVQKRIQQQGNTRIRGTDMMEGREREELHRTIWGDEPQIEELQEARVGPGESLFIPKGWWHSIKSLGSGGYLNASANWWFR